MSSIQKSVKKNLIYQLLYQIFMMVSPLLTAPYLAEVFGPERIGLSTFVTNITNYFVIVAALGISIYGNREIASVRDDKRETSQVFADIFLTHFIIGIIVLAIYIIFCLFVKENRILYIISGISILSTIFDISWFFAGIERFRATIFRNALMRLIFIACIFIFVHDKNDLTVFVGISVGTAFTGQLLTWTILPKYIYIMKPELKLIWKHVKPMFTLFVPIVALNIYHQMDKTILGVLSESQELGYYAYAEKIIAVPTSLFGVVYTVLMPRLTNIFRKRDKAEARAYLGLMYQIYLFLGVGALFGVLGIADLFTQLFFGEDFQKTALLLKGLAFSLPLIAMSNMIGNGYLLPSRKDAIWIRSLILGGIINLVADSILIPFYGSMGATWGTVLAEIIVLGVQFYCCRADLWNKKIICDIVAYVSAGIVMYVCINQILLNLNNWFGLLLASASGLFIYSVFCLFYIYKRKNIRYF